VGGSWIGKVNRFLLLQVTRPEDDCRLTLGIGVFHLGVASLSDSVRNFICFEATGAVLMISGWWRLKKIKAGKSQNGGEQACSDGGSRAAGS